MANAFDHRGMIARIGKYLAPGKTRGERAEGSPVRHIARREECGRFLAVQIGQFPFQQHVVVVGAGNVARAAGPGAAFVQRVVHGGQCSRVLAHAEIVVGAPYGDLANFTIDMAGGPGERSALAFEIGEYPIVAAFAQPVEFAL